MKKAFVLASGAAAVALVPALVFAAAPLNNINDIGTFIINTINNIVVPVLFAIAFIVFLFGAFEAFIMGASDGSAKEKGKNLMLWGLIGFFVMVSVWGLVNILVGTFSFNNNSAPAGGLPSAGVQVH